LEGLIQENDKGSLREKMFVIVVEKMKKMIIVTISLELKKLSCGESCPTIG